MKSLMSLVIVAAGLCSTVESGEVGSQSTTLLGEPNPSLAEGSAALRDGRYREGIELTLAGLQYSNPPHIVAAALSNLCAGYVALKDYAEALRKCTEAAELDPRNWRIWNNRAAANVGLGLLEAALADVRTGLEIAPASVTLHTTLRAVSERKKRADQERRKSIKA
jgi:tetratricopeptide (TPR) repeat protein